MKKNSVTKTILFVLTMILLFAFVVQKQARLWTFKPLEGVYEPSPDPPMTFENFRTGRYQEQIEPVLREQFGFREPLIRLYNQFLYDFFRTTYNKDIVVGQDGWLFFIQHVNDYYGKELYRWYASNEEAIDTYDREARLIWKLRNVLKDYDIDFMVFMAPQKGFLYPEHLPYGKADTTTVNAREFYSARFDEYGIPYIEMTKWFINMKEADTLPYSLFPQTGAHWGFSSALATDSLMRFMGDLKGISLPQLHFGPLHPSAPKTLKDDYDIEKLANLVRPLPHPDDRLLEAEVTFSTDSTTTQPSALFVGTSFLFRMYYYVPFSEIFPESQFWYYNSTVHYGEGYNEKTKTKELDMLQQLLESDYVVLFSEGEQMCKMSFGFVERALISLCVSDKRVVEVSQHLTDSLSRDPATLAHLEPITDDSVLQSKLMSRAYQLLNERPERYFAELSGDEIPTSRNPRIAEVLAIKEIKKDPTWMTNLEYQTVIQNAPLSSVLVMEAQNVLNGRPLLRDMPDLELRQAYFKRLVRNMEKSIMANPIRLESIRSKAEKNGLSLEEQLSYDANWSVHENLASTGFAFPEKEEMQRLIRRYDFLESPAFDSLVAATANEMRAKPSTMETLSEKAKRNGMTLEAQLEADARWLANDRVMKGEMDF